MPEIGGTYKQDLPTCAALYVAALNLYEPSAEMDDATTYRAELTDNDIK